MWTLCKSTIIPQWRIQDAANAAQATVNLIILFPAGARNVADYPRFVVDYPQFRDSVQFTVKMSWC